MNIIYPKAEEERKHYRERYELAAERIHGIAEELSKGDAIIPDDKKDYFSKVSGFLVQLIDTYEEIESGKFYEWSLERLQQHNFELYRDILPSNYDSSYANPTYAVEQLGKEYGRYLCILYTELREILGCVFEKRLFFLVTGLELFIEIYDLMEDEKCEPNQIRNAIYYYVSDYADITIADRTEMMLDPHHCFAVSLIETADLSDIRYLYYFGEYIGKNEIGTADHLNKMSEKEIIDMASTYTEGYRKGFELYRIDLSAKKTVNIRYRLGFERMIRAAIHQFREMGLEATIYRAVGNLIYKNGRGIRVGYGSGGANPQYNYDHRFDEALIFGKALADRKLAQQRCAYEKCADMAQAFAGPAVIEVFGEIPFVPVAKKEAIVYTQKQRKQKLEYQSASSLLTNEFIPGDQVSFTIIAYPVPEIGQKYEDIFDETVRVNTLDSIRYGKIQQRMIDALDQGEYVTVTGRNGNHTDLRVALYPLPDPEHQTDFENCLADVNIPLGEVFTSPKLEGTNGTLHVTEVYLNELKYENLTLEIKDGTVAEYMCTNFSSEKENKAYIEENLLFQHPTLPMGEFAIGTNTTAYAMGQKYGISHLLPILIAEKTGPHFAFGDTCFSHEEELITYNPDGKQMMAKENSYSALRHTDPAKAYFNCHTDITIPYHELDDIIVHCRDGKTIPLILQGRFVLEGTEELNEVL